MSQNFSIKINQFEGPLDLLLQLIEKRKLHISEVSLTEVTNDYISYINNLDNIPKQEVADFLVIASTLMMIKSATLLPQIASSEEPEDKSIEELQNRLKTYEYLKQVSNHIESLFQQNMMHFRPFRRQRVVEFRPTKDINISNLNMALSEIISRLPGPPKMTEVAVKKVISLQETMTALSQKIQASLTLKFSQATDLDKAQKVDIIMTFLGMLELIKSGLINVSQENHFSDISMTKSDL